MSRRDKATLALLAFFFLVATTIELYFVVAHRTLPEAAAAGNLLAYLLSIYGPSDQAYFAHPSAFALSLEAINVFVTQPLGIVLAYAIVQRRPWRWPLQLAVGAYLAYSVVLYFLVAHVSHFASMTDHSAGTFFMFYAANAPWLLGYGWMALDAAREISARFTTVEDRPPSASPAWWRSPRYS